MEEKEHSLTCYCTECLTEYGPAGKPFSSIRSLRRHHREEYELKIEQDSSEVAGEKPPITVYLEDENDSRRGPIILNGVTNEWSQLAFAAAVNKLRANNPGVSQQSISDMLSLFKRVLEDFEIKNVIPETFKQARAVIEEFLPRSVTYDVCIGDCMLYKGETQEAESCPTCNEPRYDSAGKPRKQYIYFPLVDTLKSLYGIPEIARLLQEHAAKLKDEPPRFVADIQETEKWKEQYGATGFFKGEPRSLSLCYSTDGGEPFQHLGISHSIWPQVLKIFNFPPEIRDKSGLFILLGVIPGPKAPKEMNAYHELLVDEMKTLMDGITVWDAHKKEYFTLNADILAYIFDWPARSKCTYHQGARAFAACPFCKHKSEFSKVLKGVSFEGSRRWLPKDDNLRTDDQGFPGKSEELRGPPSPRTDQEEYGEAMDSFNKDIHEMETDGGSGEELRLLKAGQKSVLSESGKTGREILLDIPTYDISRCQIDWMHTHKNISQNTFGVVTGSKSNFDSMVKMEEELGRFNCSNTVASTSQPAKRAKKVIQVFQLSDQQKTEADRRLVTIKVPLGYDFKVRPLFHKQMGMKSIEWIKLFSGDLMKFCMRDMLPTKQRETMFRLCSTLQRLGAPVQDMDKLPELDLEVHITFSLLERDYPLAMKTLMFHLPHHMVKIIAEFGPMTAYWMMPFERFMGSFMRMMTNRKYPTRTAAEAYKIRLFCKMMEFAELMPETTDPVETSHSHSGLEDEEEEEEGSEEEEDAELTATFILGTSTLAHLKGSSTQMHIDTKSRMYTDLYSHLEDIVCEPMTNPGDVLVVPKYFAASKRHLHTHRLHEYRCEESETRRHTKSISSVVATLYGDAVVFGRIQFFILIKNCEIAYMKWYGIGQKDEKTGLWQVSTSEDGSFLNPFESVSNISKPFPHAVEGDMLYILDCQEFDLSGLAELTN